MKGDKTAKRKTGKTPAVLDDVPKGTKGDFAVPDGTKAIGATAFLDVRGLRTISIPGSVEWIDLCLATPESAFPHFPFLGCNRLEEFRVSPDNRHFASRDGALFTKDLSVLLRAAGTKRKSFVLPRETKAVAATAFDGCPSLETFGAEEGSKAFSVRDGLLFSKDGTALVRVPPARRAPIHADECRFSVFLGAFRGCRLLPELSFDFFPAACILSGKPGDWSGQAEPAWFDLLLDEWLSECPALGAVRLPTGTFDLFGAEPARLRCLRLRKTPEIVLANEERRWKRARNLREKAEKRRLAAALKDEPEFISAKDFFSSGNDERSSDDD